MDYVFLDLIGKPVLNSPKIISIVAENFCFLEDQARFLKATLAIPIIRQLPFSNISQRLIQIGPLQREIGDQVRRCKWTLNQYEAYDESISDRIKEDLSEIRDRSIIFINDISRIELAGNSKEPQKVLMLADKLKRMHGHFIVFLYQTSEMTRSTNFSRNLQYISDATIKVKSCKIGYFKSIWWQTSPQQKTLVPPKIETDYYTCKIGKNFYSTDLLCFYDRKKVQPCYNLKGSEESNDQNISDNETDSEDVTKDSLIITDSEYRFNDELAGTIPYTIAQNAEQSQIFYYPDRDDDIDEDDPDNDLGI